MILQALANYYDRLVSKEGAVIASEGFESKDIPFIIVLGRDGKCRGVECTVSQNLGQNGHRI